MLLFPPQLHRSNGNDDMQNSMEGKQNVDGVSWGLRHFKGFRVQNEFESFQLLKLSSQTSENPAQQILFLNFDTPMISRKTNWEITSQQFWPFRGYLHIKVHAKDGMKSQMLKYEQLLKFIHLLSQCPFQKFPELSLSSVISYRQSLVATAHRTPFEFEWASKLQ